MNNPVTLDQIHSFPKVELHRHLDGAIKPELVFELAKKDGVVLAQKDARALRDTLHIRPGMSVDEIMAQFSLVISLMQTAENIERVCYTQVLDLEQENIVYAELRFAPQYHMQKGLALEDVIAASLAGFSRGETETGVMVRVIVCIARECDLEISKNVVRAARTFQRRGVVGIDLACNEAAYPPERHAGAYALTFSSKLSRTVHAGEFGRQRRKNIKTAIFDLEAHRLGHAIGLGRDRELRMICRGATIGVESCPISNLICGNIRDLRELGLRTLLREGILLSVNSDDPELFHTSLSETLFETAKAYGWGMEEIHLLMKNAVRSAFLPEREKYQLMYQYFTK